MSNTLSPTIMEAGAYQRLLLAQMGISVWVGQHEPVHDFMPEDLLNPLPANPYQAFDTQNFANQIDSQIDSQGHDNQNLNAQSPVIAEYAINDSLVTQLSPSNLAVSNPPSNAQQMPLPTPQTAPLSLTAHSQFQSVLTQNVADFRCHCYAIKIQDWVIVADVNFLAKQPQALQLWHNISQSLSLQQYEFRFPLIEINSSVNNYSLQGGGLGLLVQASFAGFVCAIGRASYLANTELMITKTDDGATHLTQKIGIVTPLAECLGNEYIQRLPYLTEMLEDYRQKRQFWQLMIASDKQYVT